MEAAAEKKAIVLCVDDEATALFFRKLVLQKSGFDVITASSAQRAMEMLSENRVDLVLSDILMPNVPGTELARQIKQQYPEMLVVLISGVNEVPQEASHADLFISKLEGPVALCEKLRMVLNKNGMSAKSV